MIPTVPIAYDSQAAFEVRDLLSVRDALCARMRERQSCIRSALEAAGVSFAAALAEAPSSTMQLFLDANERGGTSLLAVRVLSQALKLSSFIIMSGARLEISPGLRLHLSLQVQRLEALAQALSSVESQLASFAPRAPRAASR